jgi:predicted AAA+ superfamily ATPase
MFFHDIGLRNSLVRNFDPLERRVDKGYILENIVFSEIKKNLHITEELLYWRTKTKSEVDFILRGKELVPIEVKSVIKKQIPSGLRAFIEKYKCPLAIVVNENLFDILKFGKTKIYFLPFWTL